MPKIPSIIPWAVLVFFLVGCGKPAGTDPSSATPPKTGTHAGNDAPAVVKLEGPAAAVAEFLEAIRTGSDEKAAHMLSTIARQKTAALNRNVTPPASDRARFAVGRVDWVGENGARVACTWTDIDSEEQPKTDEFICMVRREPEGWRIAGIAAMVFPGEPPVVLNFEDPEDMLRQQQWMREEGRRRMEKEEGSLQAQGKEKQEKPVRR
jgi:hypothetical protein